MTMDLLAEAPTVDRKACSGCGLCVSACPAYTLSLEGTKAVVTGRKCIGCAHCEAICPENAVSCPGVDGTTLVLETIDADGGWLPYGEFDTGALVRLMRSRRSCRNFSDRPVDRRVLEDLVRIGMAAPSGSNAQPWTFTILPDRRAVVRLGEETARFLRRLNALSSRPAARAFSRLFLKDALGKYYREYHGNVERILAQWASGERDRIFNNAPAAIIVGGRLDGSTPLEDAVFASQNILLAAHAMGLGSCVIGFATAAINRTPRIRRMLGIPETEKACTVIAMGKSKEPYKRFPARRRATIRYFGGDG